MSSIPLESNGTVKTDRVELYYEAFGNPAHPAVLLIMGLAAQSLQWFPYFYEPIVRQDYYVIRFDHRDIGLSEWIEPAVWEANPYSLEDMAADAIGLLDCLKIDRAHIIGVSMGGAIAQRIAISYPNYTRTLTTMLSFADAEHLNFNPDRLPEFDPSQPSPIEVQLQFWKMLAGSRFPFDDRPYRDLYHQGFEVRKGYNPHAPIHHFTAVRRSGSRTNELGQIKAPTLVVHGTEDPLVAEAHAAACARIIPKGTYLKLDGVGHELPEGICPIVRSAMLELFNEV